MPTSLENKLYLALLALTTCPNANLDDMAYTIREREGEGWEGPSVKAWSAALDLANSAIADYNAVKPADPTNIAAMTEVPDVLMVLDQYRRESDHSLGAAEQTRADITLLTKLRPYFEMK